MRFRGLVQLAGRYRGDLPMRLKTPHKAGPAVQYAKGEQCF
jgi:hypothetical protein